MKYSLFLLLLPLLFGCRKDTSSSEQRAVTKYIRQALEKRGIDFESDYIPISWDMRSISRRDSLQLAIGPIPAADARAALPRSQRKRIEQAVASAAYQDTTRVGTRVVHVFRYKDEDSRLNSDTARFLVFRNGSMVQVWR